MTTAVPLIYAFPELSGVAEAVADLVATTQAKVLQHEGRRFRIAISGGSLVGVLEAGLLARTDIQWSQWDIYFADERLVPVESPLSNYGQAQRRVFSKLSDDISRGMRVFPVDVSTSDDPQTCADDYAQTLVHGFASKDSVRVPCFDLILLGCAPDGHTASLFPNHSALRDTAWCVPVEGPGVEGPSRVSLSVGVLCHARHVAFVVEGATKAPVMRTIMERPDKGLPASVINERAAGRVAWFVDDDAISDVIGITRKRYKFATPGAETEQ